VTEVGRSKTFDKTAPTVAVLDDFSKDPDNIVPFDDKGHGLPHGDITAKAAEQNHFNVIKLQMGGNDFSKSLGSIEKKVASGELPLGKGDVLNISMGNKDPTFEQASQLLSTPDHPLSVTKDNLDAGMRTKILDRLGEIQNDPKSSPAVRDWAKSTLESNQTIQRLQDRGINVVHASGNEGPDHFSINFMTAKYQLSSARPDGQPHQFSADHPLTTKSDGAFGVKFQQTNMFDPTKIEDQKGSYQLDGTNVGFSAAEIGRSPTSGDRYNFDSTTFRGDLAKENEVRRDPAVRTPLDSSLFSPQDSGAASPLQPKRNQVPDWSKFQTSTNPELRSPTAPATWTTPMKTKDNTQAAATNVTAEPVGADPHNVESVIAGTSYSNIRFLKGIQQQLIDEKNGVVTP
jgi:hypothetical protein